MMSQPLRIVFMGSPAAAVPCLEALAASPHDVVGVVTRPDRPAGRGQHLHPCPVAQRSRELVLKLFQPEKLIEPPFAETLRGLEIDLIVVVAYGKILKSDILDTPRHKCWNVHFSLLPQYRGASPIQASLLAGNDVTGVSIIELIEELDAGPILSQAEMQIPPDCNAEQLEAVLAPLGAKLLLQTLAQLNDGTLCKEKQDDSQASFAPRLNKSDGHLNWSGSAMEIANRIRALNPWPGTFCYLASPGARVDKVQLKIYSAEALAESSQGAPGQVEAAAPEDLVIACGTDRLKILEVQMAGKQRMATSDFLRGHPLKAGTQLI